MWRKAWGKQDADAGGQRVITGVQGGRGQKGLWSGEEAAGEDFFKGRIIKIGL